MSLSLSLCSTTSASQRASVGSQRTATATALHRNAQPLHSQLDVTTRRGPRTSAAASPTFRSPCRAARVALSPFHRAVPARQFFTRSHEFLGPAKLEAPVLHVGIGATRDDRVRNSHSAGTQATGQEGGTGSAQRNDLHATEGDEQSTDSRSVMHARLCVRADSATVRVRATFAPLAPFCFPSTSR